MPDRRFDPHSGRAAAAQVSRTHVRLDVLVNNAGVAVEASAPSLTAGQIRSVCEVGLFGVMTCLSSPPQRG